MGIFCLQIQVTSGRHLCVCLFTSVGLLSSMLLDSSCDVETTTHCSNVRGHTGCVTANSPLLPFPSVSRSSPCSVVHGNTHGSVNIVVHFCMMSVSLFGWERHVKLLEVTYTQARTCVGRCPRSPDARHKRKRSWHNGE